MTADGRALRSEQVTLSTVLEDPAVPTNGRRLRARHLWLIPGLAIAVVANMQAGDHGLGLGPLLLFGIVPHLPVLLGIGQPHARNVFGKLGVASRTELARIVSSDLSFRV